MARNPLKAKIINLVPDPKLPGRKIITVEFDDGHEEGPWRQSFSLLFNRPISLEEFAEHIRSQEEVEIKRPEDPYEFLVDSKGKQFELDLSKPKEEPDGDQHDA